MNHSRRPAAVLVSLLLASSSCFAQVQRAQQPSAPNVSELQRRIEVLELRLSLLDKRVPARWASLNCNSGGYDEFLLESSALTFFASCAKIEPYLEGHKISIRLGNPHTFNFHGVKGKLYYGSDWAEAFSRHVQVSVLDGLRGGTWTTIVVTVNPSKAEDMRSIGLELAAATNEAWR